MDTGSIGIDISLGSHHMGSDAITEGANDYFYTAACDKGSNGEYLKDKCRAVTGIWEAGEMALFISSYGGRYDDALESINNVIEGRVYFIAETPGGQLVASRPGSYNVVTEEYYLTPEIDGDSYAPPRALARDSVAQLLAEDLQDVTVRFFVKLDEPTSVRVPSTPPAQGGETPVEEPRGDVSVSDAEAKGAEEGQEQPRTEVEDQTDVLSPVADDARNKEEEVLAEASDRGSQGAREEQPVGAVSDEGTPAAVPAAESGLVAEQEVGEGSSLEGKEAAEPGVGDSSDSETALKRDDALAIDTEHKTLEDTPLVGTDSREGASVPDAVERAEMEGMTEREAENIVQAPQLPVVDHAQESGISPQGIESTAEARPQVEVRTDGAGTQVDLASGLPEDAGDVAEGLQIQSSVDPDNLADSGTGIQEQENTQQVTAKEQTPTSVTGAGGQYDDSALDTSVLSTFRDEDFDAMMESFDLSL